MARLVAFIPARSGSKRIPHKNTRKLGAHPLLAYSIRAAIESEVFDDVVCATDNEQYAAIAKHYGASVPMLRPEEISGDKSPDIDWVDWILSVLEKQGKSYEIFSILRPTSPFRKSSTIRRACSSFLAAAGADSLRAIEKCEQHPGKMWIVTGDRIVPLLPFSNDAVPWHSSQYAALPQVYVQNASLEVAWTRIVREQRSISGNSIIPFFTNEFEGLDVNKEFDWWKAERILESNPSALPEINVTPFDSVKV